MDTFNEEVLNAKGNLGDGLLDTVQKRLPHAMHSEIINQRKRALLERRRENKNKEQEQNAGGK